MPQLQDPNFWHTVLLIVQQDREGALGFIINRPSEVPLAAVLKEEDIKVPKQIPTWTGGPVGLENGLILADKLYDGAPEDDIVGDGILLTSHHQALTSLVTNAEDRCADITVPLGSRHAYRFLIGYAGWGSKQLEDEVRQGSWLQLDYDHNLVFDTPWSTMWETAIANLGVSPNELALPGPSQYLN